MTRTLSLCDPAPWILASREFNDDPRPIEIQGTVNADRYLFGQLDAIECPHRRAEFFHDYMSVKFYLHQGTDQSLKARRCLKNSYVRFLRGWGFDSNSVEGAVLKGWVENRLGLPPNYHKQPISCDLQDDYTPYDIDKMQGRQRSNSVNEQLDLLYRYTQYELQRKAPTRRWMTLYRGTYDAHEHKITERVSKRSYFVSLNNLSSFTSELERAWEFGTTVWSISVPICKIFFYGDLLPSSILKGENEYLVIGGEFRVTEVTG